jgi:hypothetical protein
MPVFWAPGGDGGGAIQSLHRPGGLLKSARERMDIIAAYGEAGTYRGAAEIAGTTHKTVKRVIVRHEAGGTVPERAARDHNYDGVAVLVAERVEKTAGRISAKRLLSAARAAGFTGSDRNFRRLVAQASSWPGSRRW